MPPGFPHPLHVRRSLFDLVCRGVPVERAARELGVSKTSAHTWWSQAGAMLLLTSKMLGGPVHKGRPDAPGGRGHRLSLDERIEVMRGRDQGLSYAEIGARIGRDKAVVWREVARNRNADGDYHAAMAHSRAAQRARRPKPFKLADPHLGAAVTEWMEQGWSPRLIALVLAQAHGGDRLRRVSHETIYQALYVQTRGHLRADLHRCLSTKRATRKSGTSSSRHHSPYADAFTIAKRPAEAEDRAVPGHWEGDLIMGAPGCGAIGTLVERSTRFTILLHLPHGHGAEEVAAAMITAMAKLPEHLRRTITWDRGVELARYRDIEMALQAPVYFCDPHSPWQRGTNENTNRLLRFWFAKSSDLREHTVEDLKRVQDLLNKRPRPTLDLETPAARLAELLDAAA
jgi:IS30 family transposase